MLVKTSAWQGRRVLVTGHTGFKGGWLSLWLHQLGAEVTGFSLPAPTEPSLFEQTRLTELVNHIEGDVRDMKVADDELDRHVSGDFADTSLEGVQKVVGTGDFVHFHKGWIPDTFAGLEKQKVCFAHIDLDLYQGVLDTLAFVYPRMPTGGVIVCDDYGFASCPGARRAIEEFFADKPEKPLALLTGQAVIHKL